MRMGIRELRAGLAAAVRRAEAGEEITVTVGGRPVARLAPLGTAGVTLEDLVAIGALKAPRGRRTEPRPIDVPVDARTDRALREVR
jgi:prevent-host-death family protein